MLHFVGSQLLIAVGTVYVVPELLALVKRIVVSSVVPGLAVDFHLIGSVLGELKVNRCLGRVGLNRLRNALVGFIVASIVGSSSDDKLFLPFGDGQNFGRGHDGARSAVGVVPQRLW